MSETNFLSILDERAPGRKWNFQQKVLAVGVFLFCIVPLLLSALLILLMVITDGQTIVNM